MSAPFTGENLTCIRGDRLVFARLSFEVTAGGALLLTGPNGSGKTSLLRLMAGLAVQSDGVIRFGGEDVREDLIAHRANLHYVAHYDAAKPALTAHENLAFWTAMHGGGDASWPRVGGVGRRRRRHVRHLWRVLACAPELSLGMVGN